MSDAAEWPSVHDYGRKRDPDADLIKRVATAIAKERDGALRGESTYPMHEAEARVLIAAFRAFKTS